METTPTISLCMIAKDEEHIIGQAIESVKDLVSEIILIDTGSTDKTVEIAEALGAEVYHRPWDDDFSAPRNLSLEKATCDWILVLDSDEALAKEDHYTLRELIKEKSVCYEFAQRHYSNDARLSNFSPCRGRYKDWERNYGGYFESNCCRLFPNHEGLHFQGKIHELVEHSISQIGRHKTVHLNIPIHHYGHTPEAKALKDKRELYSSLGKKKTEIDPDSWKNFYELAVEHNCNGRLKESVENFKEAIKRNASYVPTWTNMGYVLCELGEHQEAIKSLNQALTLDPMACEAHCNMGVVYMRQRNWIFAEAHFKKAIQIKPDYINAIRNLGQVYLNARASEQAVTVFKEALRMLPNDPTAKSNLAIAYMLGGKLAEAEQLFNETLTQDPNNSQACYHMGIILKSQEKLLEAAAMLEKFCTAEEAKPGFSYDAELGKAVKQIRAECQLLRKPPQDVPSVK